MTESRLVPRKVPSQERARRTVERILAAAEVVFDEAGYAGATTNEIAREAGISIGSLYQYFPHKDALLVELAHRHVDSMMTAVDTYTSTVASDAVDIDTILNDLVGLLVAQHELDHLHAIIAHQAPRTRELERELARARERFIDVADQILVDRIPGSGVRRIAAAVVVAILDATVHQVILLETPGEHRDRAVELMLASVAGVIDKAAFGTQKETY